MRCFTSGSSDISFLSKPRRCWIRREEKLIRLSDALAGPEMFSLRGSRVLAVSGPFPHAKGREKALGLSLFKPHLDEALITPPLGRLA